MLVPSTNATLLLTFYYKTGDGQGVGVRVSFTHRWSTGRCLALDWLEEGMEEVWRIAQRVREAGGAVYLVGGGVRDRLLGRAPGDQDFCVTGLTTQAFTQAVPSAFVTGNDFPVFRVRLGARYVEFALARTERKVHPGHTGFAAQVAPDVSIVDDLLRRDVTINAMAVALDTGTLIDPFGGAKDVQEGILRAVSPAFAEDPLRVYRVARLAAQLTFAVAPQTQVLMTALRPELATLSAERVLQELRKGLLTSRPSLFFETLRQAQVLDVHFPELAALVGVVQPLRYHPEGDAYVHTLQVVDVAAQRERAEIVRYAALLHDVGKALTPQDQWPAHRGHEARGVPLVRNFSQRLKVPTAWRKAAVFAAEYHMLLHGWQQLRPATIVDLFAKAARNPLGVPGFAAVCEADACGRNNAADRCLDTQEWVALYTELESAVNGDTLVGQLPPARDPVTGRAFGEALRRARIAYVRRYLRERAQRSYMPT